MNEIKHESTPPNTFKNANTKVYMFELLNSQSDNRNTLTFFCKPKKWDVL